MLDFVGKALRQRLDQLAVLRDGGDPRCGARKQIQYATGTTLTEQRLEVFAHLAGMQLNFLIELGAGTRAGEDRAGEPFA